MKLKHVANATSKVSPNNFPIRKFKKKSPEQIFVCCMPGCPRAMLRAMPSYELDNLARRSSRRPTTRSHLNLMKAKKPPLIPRLRKLAWHAPTSTLNTTTAQLLSHHTLHSTHLNPTQCNCTQCVSYFAAQLAGLMWYELRPRRTTAHFCDPLQRK